jgi:hypothetical protein
LISQRSANPQIDVDTCTRLGIVASSNVHTGTPSWSTTKFLVADISIFPEMLLTSRPRYR